MNASITIHLPPPPKPPPGYKLDDYGIVAAHPISQFAEVGFGLGPEDAARSAAGCLAGHFRVVVGAVPDDPSLPSKVCEAMLDTQRWTPWKNC